MRRETYEKQSSRALHLNFSIWYWSYFLYVFNGRREQKGNRCRKRGWWRKTEATDDGSALVQSCISCHGADLTGGMGPNLHGKDEARIVDVLTNGIPGTPMTPGMKNEAEAKEIAKYISTLK